MHHGFALRYLAEVMQWLEDQEGKEINWLRVMSEFKYDSYHDFLSGSRFAESLLNWLQQFDAEDRHIAYGILKDKLIFIGLPEIQQLVRRSFPANILPFLERRAARKIHCPRYLLGSSEQSISVLDSVIKKTLFVALSDGARIDYFRRATLGKVSNEQVLTTHEVSEKKWKDLHEELIARTNDEKATFEAVVLIDDFTASGTTLIRRKDTEWKGKLVKICDIFNSRGALFAQDFNIAIHHYIGTKSVSSVLGSALMQLKPDPIFKSLFKGGDPEVSFGMQLQDAELVLPGNSSAIDKFLSKYYDPTIMTKHLSLGGTDVKHGFANCGLPLIIEHNTPNNSLAILWAESPPNSVNSKRMRPLFRRRQRHN